MKIFMVVALAVFCFAQNSPEKPDRNASNGQKESGNASNAPVVVNCNESTGTVADHNGKEAPEWYATVQWSNWVLVGVAAITGFVIWLQTVETGRAARAALMSAQAASDGVKSFISKERARIWVEPDIFDLSPPDSLSGHTVKYSVIPYAPTVAIVDKTAVEASLSKSSDPPVGPILNEMDLHTVILPSEPATEQRERLHILSQDEIALIDSEQLFVHFRGFIRYRDFHQDGRETAFCCTWKMRVIGGIRIWKWTKSGPSDANRET
jgi:hypothetical protein